MQINNNFNMKAAGFNLGSYRFTQQELLKVPCVFVARLKRASSMQKKKCLEACLSILFILQHDMQITKNRVITLFSIEGYFTVEH